MWLAALTMSATGSSAPGRVNSPISRIRRFLSSTSKPRHVASLEALEPLDVMRAAADLSQLLQRLIGVVTELAGADRGRTRCPQGHDANIGRRLMFKRRIYYQRRKIDVSQVFAGRPASA
jgi:hypothetical protein